VSAYFDSSALLAAYVTEVHSPAARRALRRQGSIPFTALHGLELRNSLELLVGRAVLSAGERDGLVNQIQEDRRAGRLIDTAADWQAILTIAGDLSTAHTRKYLTRSLDLLHVAAALELKCETFVSGDRRQLKAARAAKLRPVDITRPGRKASEEGRKRGDNRTP
jgi:predicted nucleic acid-binding protein